MIRLVVDMYERLSGREARIRLKGLKKWKIQKGKLHKEFSFRSFDDAIRFINRLRPIADRMNHHPEIYNVYNKVVVDLVTHDANGLTILDFEFAERVDSITHG